ncbi:NAD-dependent epimerase/dehydratase family protein [Candidatus Pelagibacter sp.]|nr:NAD-dependent epimerase/dehydratase family protein [Candidatus Pelagibacter sp.]|tara:strand:- start:3753 stop:4553 length:801 start_codon:yes stop_codon:yes gene_type:complete
MKKNKRCIITGTNSVIGKYLTLRFQQDGWTIIKISSKKNKGSHYHKLGSQIKIENNIVRNADLLIHCAYDFSLNQWNEIVDVNVKGSKDIFKFAHENQVKTIINISSLSSYNDANSKYGKAKFLIEKTGKIFNVINLRCGLIITNNKKSLYCKIKNISKKYFFFPLIGNGHQKIHLLKLNKLFSEIFKILDNKKKLKDQIVYVGDVKFILFKDFVKKFNKNKFFIYVPKFIIKNILIIFDFFKINIGFNYDNYLGLVRYNKKIKFK